MSKSKINLKAKLTAISLIIFCLCFCFSCGSKGVYGGFESHLILTPDDAPIRVIDGWEQKAMSAFDTGLTESEQKKQTSERVKELYRMVVDEQKKPVFSEDDPIKPVYDNAVKVLNRYILNSWSEGKEYEKVHALHDYLAMEIDYDYDLYETYKQWRQGKTEKTEADDVDFTINSAFNIDGVFLNKTAVCDGLSHAFTFLCAMEGIRSTIVTGTYLGASHAWNKVRLNGNWYNVDITADAATYTFGDDGERRKVLSHGYFLLSDATMKKFTPIAGQDAHVFSSIGAEAVCDYDYYTTQQYFIGKNVYDITVTSAEELNGLFDDVNNSGRRVKNVEVKLKFENKNYAAVNDAEIYRSDVAAAYDKITSDFVISSFTSPYFRYPNGVYVFLFYN